MTQILESTFTLIFEIMSIVKRNKQKTKDVVVSYSTKSFSEKNWWENEGSTGG